MVARFRRGFWHVGLSAGWRKSHFPARWVRVPARWVLRFRRVVGGLERERREREECLAGLMSLSRRERLGLSVDTYRAQMGLNFAVQLSLREYPFGSYEARPRKDNVGAFSS